MRLGKFVADARALSRAFADLLAVDHDADRAASYELAVSARAFSRNTKAVVDDKLSFSATLMRAGEVDAANRLIEDLEKDVREEEAALMERVNEVSAARAVHRASLTRARLARLVAVAMTGCLLLASSAIGMTVVNMFEDRADADRLARWAAGRGVSRYDAFSLGHRAGPGIRQVSLAPGVKVKMTAREFETYKELTVAGVDPAGLEEFLNQVLGPQLAEKVRRVMAATSVGDTVANTTQSVEVLAAQITKTKKKGVRRAKADQPAEEKKKESEPEPSPNPEPSPSESDDDGELPGGSGDDDGGEGTDGDDDGGSSSGPSIEPLR